MKAEKLKARIRELERQAFIAERHRFERLKATRAQGSFSAEILAAGIAHEFNNILGALDGHAEWALESGETSDLKEALALVREGCRRASQVTRALQGMGTPQEESKSIFALAPEVNKICSLLQPMAEKHGVKISLSSQSAPRVYGSRLSFQEILQNLIKNAIEVAPNGTKIGVSMIAKSGRVELAVSDCGPGVPKAFSSKIFDPFFTTKGVMKAVLDVAAASGPTGDVVAGTGLGLFLSRVRAEELGGRLELSSKKREGYTGATFLLSLPLVSGRDAARQKRIKKRT